MHLGDHGINVLIIHILLDHDLPKPSEISIDLSHWQSILVIYVGEGSKNILLRKKIQFI